MSYDLHSKITTKLDALSIQHEQLTKELEDPEVLADHREVRSRNIKRAALDPLVTECHFFVALLFISVESFLVFIGDAVLGA